ncbi:dTDP-4-dehydrorhamnose 3,5-epimerase [Fusibacter sp. 3D3]|uniref:dTDP-4-dehydrorhamnose 3,5-epimerase n=1 Tax=Fusibacter sp. 3D3 TaxID=1048380 RepID=UPI0008539EA9|nr:dTDP-4-dehydrorhamnose 3,5-epimerase [Fusibacter sp. 3D3]GAU75651.1 dTDP-4-dehydrorhamnose 3,5-epimerase [Fusibacter sp. 3D3]
MYKVTKTNISDCLEIHLTPFEDERGIIFKPFHCLDFNRLRLKSDFKEELVVKSKKNVLRGLHFQKPPYTQGKLIYCIQGEIMDVAVDLRKSSSTYGQHVIFYLDSEKYNMAYIPEGFAHGYLVLSESATVTYKMTEVYAPKCEDGILWNSAGIKWPISDVILSEKDLELKSLEVFKSPF